VVQYDRTFGSKKASANGFTIPYLLPKKKSTILFINNLFNFEKVITQPDSVMYERHVFIIECISVCSKTSEWNQTWYGKIEYGMVHVPTWYALLWFGKFVSVC
jgi:hypothetical protein